MNNRRRRIGSAIEAAQTALAIAVILAVVVVFMVYVVGPRI